MQVPELVTQLGEECKELKGRDFAHLMLLSHDFAEDCSKITESIWIYSMESTHMQHKAALNWGL